MSDPEFYVSLELDGVPRVDREIISEALFAAGALGIEESYRPGEAPALKQPWDEPSLATEPPYLILKAWFMGEIPELSAKVGSQRFGTSKTPLSGLSGLSWRWEKVEDRDWDAEWRASVVPIEVDGLVIVPPWDGHLRETEKERIVIVIEPGQGFGTGQHETTRAALRHLLSIARNSPPETCKTALDVGSGSGILALAAAKLGMIAEGIDVELSAVRDARQNAQHNELTVDFSDRPLRKIAGPYDVVLANLHAELLLKMADDLIRVTGGHIVLAGILSDRSPQVEARFDEALARVDRAVDGEWVSLVYRVRA